MAGLEALADLLTRRDPTSPLRCTCKSRANLTATLAGQGWRVSSTTVGRLLRMSMVGRTGALCRDSGRITSPRRPNRRKWCSPHASVVPKRARLSRRAKRPHRMARQRDLNDACLGTRSSILRHQCRIEATAKAGAPNAHPRFVACHVLHPVRNRLANTDARGHGRVEARFHRARWQAVNCSALCHRRAHTGSPPASRCGSGLSAGQQDTDGAGLMTTTGTEEQVREEYFESHATGVEVEAEVPPSQDEPKPWDPEKIRIHTKHYSLRQLVDMIAEGDIDLAPDFQRHYVWKPRQRWSLIESLLLGIPLPSFYFNEDTSGLLQVVDGVQRLTTIFEYVSTRSFKLGPVTYLHDLEGQGFSDLAAMFRRRLNSAQFVAHVIDPQTPYRVKFEIFRRINTGGSPLSAQEIRHCMSEAKSRAFLKELANDESFLKATGAVLKSHPRMADQEVALRFVGFRLFTPDEYARYGSFDEFLGIVTKRLDDHLNDEDLDRLRADFVRGMTNCHAVFGDYAFRKWPLRTDRRNPINRGLFESWGTALADHDEAAVRAGTAALVERARMMMTTNSAFIDSISGSTGDAGNVRTRLRTVREAVAEVLG